jgi:hypothetical protein
MRFDESKSAASIYSRSICWLVDVTIESRRLGKGTTNFTQAPASVRTEVCDRSSSAWGMSTCYLL